MSGEEEDNETAGGFEALGLQKELLTALTQLGYEEPTAIQRMAVPPLLEGKDVLGQAATGTGKTAAFALPMLQRLPKKKRPMFGVGALVLVPTRELAMQVAEACHRYGKDLGVSVLPIYGGQPFDQQLRRLKGGVDVVVATPGRALDHLRRKTLKLDEVVIAVVDEADEMLDLGFADDLDALLGAVPEACQVALFSATLPPRIAALAERHLSDPARIRIRADPSDSESIPKITQIAYVVPGALKEVALSRVLDAEGPQSAIIFCRTRLEVERLSERMNSQGYEAGALHGGLSQEQRDRITRRFKTGQLQLLVATDVAARGLHVENLSHVINYDLPNAPEAYVHRIGRTGRAGREGRAISFCEPREHRFLKVIERVTRQPIQVGAVPTVVDLRTRRLEVTKATVEESLKREDLDRYRGTVETLTASGGDLMDVAAAAIAALHEQLNPEREDDTREIPVFRDKPQGRPVDDRGPRGKWPDRGPKAPERKPYARPDRAAREAAASDPSFVAEARHAAERSLKEAPAAKKGGFVPSARRTWDEAPSKKAERPVWESTEAGERTAPERPARTGAAERKERVPYDQRASAKKRPADRETFSGTRLFVSIGRSAGLRPADLVGAIANEASVDRTAIGAIQISEHHSFVEIADEHVTEVVSALKQATIRGRKVKVDRDRTGGPRPPPKK